MPRVDHVTASRLTDCRVQTYGNKYLGYVEDIVIDPMQGRVTHAIVAVDATLPGTKRRLLVPWSDFVKAYNEQLLTLDNQKEGLDGYPEAPFDLTHRGLWAGAPEGEGASASFMA